MEQTQKVTSINNKQMLDDLQRRAFKYFMHEVNMENGLVADKTEKEGWPASIAAVGFGLSVYPIGVLQGWLEREEAVERTLNTARFFWNSPQSKEPDATGYKGFYYHFLNQETGKRKWDSELSTVDTAFLVAGMMVAAHYFDQDTEEEEEIRTLADKIYRRIDWEWATNGKATLCHGWKPEEGFLPYHWEGYDESLLLYIMALGSPTHSISEESYNATVAEYKWKCIYGHDVLYAGPLFIHQYPHIWIDFRDLQDEYMRDRGTDYFKNSRKATYIQQEYAIRNPKEFEGYDEFHWGITASDGPGPATKQINGIERVFFDYIARGVPYGPDDGTLAPWAAVTSLPFAPEIVLPTIRNFNQMVLKEDDNPYGYKATINQTFPDKDQSEIWLSDYHFGINQGPLVLTIENYQTEMIWDLIKRSPHVERGLRRAGFTGGWLEG